MTTNLIEQDKQHRLLALDPTKSFIVQAPAGSGKTELLIQRLLTLLDQVNKPEEILAITFTKKAANEMRTRVLKALKSAMHDPEPESNHAKQTWQLAKNVLKRDRHFQWNIIDNPNQLRIQTIDSLCSYLTKQMPLLSQFGAQPDLTTDPQALYREAVQEVLMHVEENYAWSSEIANLLTHLDNDLNKLNDLLVNLLSKRDQWLPYIQFTNTNEDIKVKLEHHLGLVIRDSLQALHELFPKQLTRQLLSLARYAATNLNLNNSDSEITACEQLMDLPGCLVTDKKAWIGISKLLLTKQFAFRKKASDDIGFPAQKNCKNAREISLHAEFKQRYSELIQLINDRNDLRLALMEVQLLPNASYDDNQWEILQSLLYILKIVTAQLRVTFQQHGQIDFIENTQAALAALGNEGNPTDLALALDYQIKNILIDEFQDTSFTQYQLIEKLTAGWEENDGRTLFVVGDPMQSIYRFREADVGLFIRMRTQGIGNIKLIPLTLAVNFRSTSEIVEWNNSQFRAIFPKFNDMATGAVTFNESVAFSSSTKSSDEKVIETHGFVDSETDTEAKAIIELIANTKKHYPTDKIAILVRSRSHLSAIIPALKKAQLSYRAIDIDPLASRQHIQDLLSLTRALQHPADRIAWLAILRAPWCGLSLADLLIIAGGDPYATIQSQLDNPAIIEKLSLEGRLAINRIYPILKTKIAARERIDIRTWIESTWILLGGPACLQNYSDLDDANAFFNLLAEFSLSNDLITLDQLNDCINQLFATSHSDDTSVQIMTIHTAKGLEFDTVILPQLERKNPSDDKSLLQWMERPLVNNQVALLLAPIHAIGNDKDAIYEYIHRQHKIKSDYETDRLFYVATTRAKKRLYLFFNAKSKDSQNIQVSPGSFLEKIWPQLEKQKDKILNRIDSAPVNPSPEIDHIHRSIMKIDSQWNNPITELNVSQVVLHQKPGGFKMRIDSAKQIGVVVHRILELLTVHGIYWWTHQSKTEQKELLKHLLKQAGICYMELDSSIMIAAKAIQNTLTDKRGLWILDNHNEAASELALTAIIDSTPVNLVIDRTFIDKDGTRWIIDYKTTTFSKQDLDEFLNQEKQKYLTQMENYHKAFQLIENRPVRLGLYFPALPAWHEWE